ncbi:unnamed protein product [Calypogeia fissa]
MATRDSTVPVDAEKGYNAQGPTAKLRLIDVVLRFLTFACTLAAFVVMISNLQSVRPFPGVKIWAKYHYSDAFMWFVVANGIAFSYALLTLLFMSFNKSPKIARGILILDLLVAYMILSAASAATAVAYIGKNGLSQTRWSPICGTFHRYCDHVLGSLVACFLGWLNLTIIIIVGLHQRY